MRSVYRLIIFASVLVAFVEPAKTHAEARHRRPRLHNHKTVSRATTAAKLPAAPAKKLPSAPPPQPPTVRATQSPTSPVAKPSTPPAFPPAAPAATSIKPNCQPRIDRFTTPVGSSGSSWAQLSKRLDSYQMNRGGGVELVLNPPVGPVTLSTDGTTNDKLGDGSTLNSTFALLYGKITFNLTASPVPGTIVAAVMIGTETFDEIDVEILGGDLGHWQTNVFRPAPGETQPLYGVFGGVQNYPGQETLNQPHSYSVDWSPQRIAWSVDGRLVRALTPSQTVRNGQQHFPSAMSRIQLGIWDASNPSGTSVWAKGPIPWSKLGGRKISTLITSVQVECPY